MCHGGPISFSGFVKQVFVYEPPAPFLVLYEFVAFLQVRASPVRLFRWRMSSFTSGGSEYLRDGIRVLAASARSFKTSWLICLPRDATCLRILLSSTSHFPHRLFTHGLPLKKGHLEKRVSRTPAWSEGRASLRFMMHMHTIIKCR